MVKFESVLESDVTGGSSSTSVGSGLISGETRGRDGGRGGGVWDRGLDGDEPCPEPGLLHRVKLRFWSKLKLSLFGEEPVRLFRESTSWIGAEVTSWLKFLSRMLSVTFRGTMEK